MSDSTRRAALGAILAVPLTGGGATALPQQAAQVAPTSDLAQACDWGVAHLSWINDTSQPGRWSDEKLHDELERIDAVLDRIASEPSADRADIVAKVRLILASDGEHLGMSDCTDDRALLTVLREVIRLCA